MGRKLDIDLSAERFGREIPAEDFALLRREAPIWWSPRDSCWVVTTHRLVERINRDPSTFASGLGVGPPAEDSGKSPSILVAMDPPVHTAYRRLVARPFTPRAIAPLEPMVRSITSEVVYDMVERGGGDFITDIAARVPFRVIATMLGVPFEDEADLFAWSNAMIPNADPDYRTTPETAAKATASMDAYAARLLEQHRQNPHDDLTDVLLTLRKDDEPLVQNDLVNFVRTFITGGSETTRHLISNGLLALLTNPEVLRAFIDGKLATDPLIEEMLRDATPVMHHSRHATTDVTVEGVDIKRGQRVALWMWSANHDETVFEHPDRFTPDRSPNPHTSLGGGGPHYCLGASLARLEARVVFEELRPHLARMAMSGPVERVWSSFVNGIKRLPIEIV
jgi:cholest-4-en-3-one 26-monooxygenase